MKKLVLVASIAFCMGGCDSSGDSWMPLVAKNHWTYTVSAGMVSAVRSVEVNGEEPCGSLQGLRLHGAMGDSVMAWDGNKLVASRLAGTSFRPPLPILLSQPGEVHWNGGMSLPGKTWESKAKLEVKLSKEDVGGRKLEVLVAKLSVTGPDSPVETETIFVRNIGIYRQEERVANRLTRKILYISGP